MTSRSTTIESVEVYSDISALARACALRFILLARDAVNARGLFTVALAGGSTPRSLYRLLAADQNLHDSVPWEKIHFFFGDERYVPPDDAQSNFGMANQELFRFLPRDGPKVHRVHTDQPDVQNAALEYEKEIMEFFESRHLTATGFARFDLVLLGMGPDGHVASLFPNSSALDETVHWVVANWVEKLKAYRITLTLPVLNNSAEVIFLVVGLEKAKVVGEVFRPANKVSPYPAQMVRPNNGSKRWMLDKDAASMIPNAV
jgi:6-phosphogluconolactonase